MKSSAHWLNWKCGLNLGAACERVRVAHALPGLPKTSALFQQGRLSFSKVRAITRVATPKNEQVLLKRQHESCSKNKKAFPRKRF